MKKNYNVSLVYQGDNTNAVVLCVYRVIYTWFLTTIILLCTSIAT